MLVLAALPGTAAAQTITTFAGGGVGDGAPATSGALNLPLSLAVDGSGSLFIADNSNHRIRKVAAGTGIITTVAGTGTAGFSGDGGAATAAKVNAPRAVAVDASGNLFIADRANHRSARSTV